MTWPIVTMQLQHEPDIVSVRQRAHRLAELLQFERQDQTRIATAVSEIARNAYSYGGGGRVTFSLDETATPQMFLIAIVDQGKGIADLDAVLEGRFRSVAGMGLGIRGARRLLDRFNIKTGPTGTQVELGHSLPSRAPRITRDSLGTIASALSAERETDALLVLHEQNRELLQSLEEIRRRQDEADQLNRELGDTNRGVVALYAELDARAEQLRQASEIKSRFLSNMSHEFRTPLNSMLALSRLLLDGIDGQLNTEQARQVGYIRKSAQDLLELVNDLLDLAKVEAGKVELKNGRFTVNELFGTLRGALKPLPRSPDVDLVFESADDLPELLTDEGKVAQVLRNFISNALKFTERGEVHVSGHFESQAHRVVFAVRDTGVGIAAADHERVFEEFSQVDGQLQRGKHGTGLGLPLSRHLAELLGGEVWLESEPGHGSTFYLAIPVQLGASQTEPEAEPAARERKRILIVDDDETFRYVLRQILNEQHRYDVLEAADGQHGLDRVHDSHPDLVILDLQMPRVSGIEVLQILRSDAATNALPVIVSTSLHIDAELAAKLPEGIPILPKQALSRDRVTGLLQRLIGT
jgi:signal transduction histidine kinase